MKAFRIYGKELTILLFIVLASLPLMAFKTEYQINTMLNGATNGQLLIGRTGGDPTLATLTAGSGIGITNGAGSITITSSSVYPASDADGQLMIGSAGGTYAKGTISGTSNQVTVTNGTNSITLSTPQNIATASTPQFARLGLGTAADGTAEIKLTNGALLNNAVASTLTVTSPVEAHTNATSATFTTPIFALVMGTTGGINIKKAEATTGALSGGTGSCAVNVPSGAVLLGSQLRVDTAITSGDGGTTWGAIYATGSTATIAANTTSFNKSTKVSQFFNPNAATPITTGTTTITVAPNSGTFSGGVVRCITYYLDFTAMADAP